MTDGWTEEAKKQNAVISSVRQVIGKAMEGGVLRKEDEIKYRDILPVLGDSEGVVKSKIDGLEKRLRKKLDTRINSLSDAGFDVGKFRDRQGGHPTAAVAPSTSKTVRMKAPDGSVQDVPESDVQHYIQLGAARVR